jgi:hypothetical protein
MNDEKTPWALGATAEMAAFYNAYLQLAIHGQENKNQTYYNFLVAHSILLLAWATVFSVTATAIAGAMAATLLCVIGFLSAGMWFPIGDDYSNASDRYGKAVRDVEERFPTGLRARSMFEKVIARRN